MSSANDFPLGFPMGSYGDSTELVRKGDLVHEDLSDDDDDFSDETLLERLWGLTEMFPERLRTVTSGAAEFSWLSAKWFYGMSRSVTWVLGSSAMILFLPVMFESERAQMEAMQMQQQRQVLLGPNAAVSAGKGMQPPMAAPPMPH